MKKSVQLIRLLIFLFISIPILSQAQGFRYASVQYQVQDANATTFTVKFRIEEIWDASSAIFSGKSFGQVVNVSDINFGDANTGGLQLIYDADLLGGVKRGVAEITHVYAVGSDYTADILSFSRTGTLTNNAGGAYRLRTKVVYPFNGYQSPAINLGVPISIVSDPLIATVGTIDVGSSVLFDASVFNSSYSLPDGQNSGMLGSNFPTFSNYSIDANTGVISYTLAPGSPTGDYATQVRVADNFGGEATVDFIISVVGCSAPAPSFISPTPANGFELIVNPGQNVSFSIAAQSNDIGANTEFSAVGIPPTASYVESGVPSNPYSATFSWTPTVASIGLRSITFTAKNTSGCDRTTSTTVKIRVQRPVPQAELTLIDSCSDNSDSLYWKVINTSSFAVPFQWTILNTNPSIDSLSLAKPGETFFATPTIAGNAVSIAWYDDDIDVNIDTTIWNGGLCTPPACFTTINVSNCTENGAPVTFYKGYSTGFDLSASGTGTPPYTYDWSTGDTTQNIFVVPNAATIYYVTITDTFGCVSEDSVALLYEDLTANNCYNCDPIITTPNNSNCGSGNHGHNNNSSCNHNNCSKRNCNHTNCGNHKCHHKNSCGRNSCNNNHSGGNCNQGNCGNNNNSSCGHTNCSRRTCNHNNCNNHSCHHKNSCNYYYCNNNHQGGNCTQGNCGNNGNGNGGNKMTICHIPPGNPGNAHTIQISPNAWAAHAAHGDVQGSCDGEYGNCDLVKYPNNCRIKMCKTYGWGCWNGSVTVSVKAKDVDYYLNCGNYTLGPCSSNKTEVVYDMLFDMNVMPNPTADGRFTLGYQLFDKTNVEISVIDYMGRVVYNKPAEEVEEGLHEENIELDNVSAGIYIVSLTAYGEVWTQKIQVLK